MRASAVVAILAGAAVVVGAIGGITYAAFTAATANPASSFAAKRIYSAERSTSAWKLSDRSSGTATDRSAEVAFADDGRTVSTGTWAGAFSSSRYLELDPYGSLPAGLSVTDASFVLRFRTTSGTGCFYFEVRSASTGAVLATHGSAGSPLACHGTTLQTTSTAIPSVSTSDLANDVRIRIFGQRSGGGGTWVLDEATVTGSTPYMGFTLYRKIGVDATTGTPVTAPWELAVSDDGARYQTSNWATSYSGTRYVEYTFPATVPGAATVSGVAVDIGYRPTTNGANACFYLEIYAGGSLIGTHGSTGSSLSCHNSNASTLVHAEALPEVDTAAEANALTVRMYGRNTSGSMQIDLARLRITSGLDAGSGCANPGSTTLYATADSHVRENAATTNFGTAADVRVRSAPGNNRRTLVSFALPTLSPGCAVTGATLRLFQTTSEGTRTLQVFRAAAAWSETGVTWSNQPATAGTAATGTNGTGWRDVVVTQHVLDQYASGNHGFVVRDSVEGVASDEQQIVDSREATNDPQLVLTVG